jgi:hypothetical protein
MFIPLAIILFVAAEFVIGWWALPVVGVVLGVVGARRNFVGVQIAVAALAAWGLLFGWSAVHGELRTFLDALALSMKLEPWQLMVALTALPALLAGPAAGLGSGLRNLLQPVAEPARTAPTAAGLGA